MTTDANEPAGAAGGYPPTPPAHATPQERAVMHWFMRVEGDGDRFRCSLVGTDAPDIRFQQGHPTRGQADFCCYMLAKAIVFCGREVLG